MTATSARGGADESLPINVDLEQEVIGGVLSSNEVYWRVPFLEARQIIDRGSRLADVAGHIRAARKWMRARGAELHLYILDYLGLVVPADRYRGNRNNEVGEISAGLKRMAKEERLPLLCLHQLSRAVESRGRSDRRPQLQDLRDSGSLEQDADVVMFVYRDSYYLERRGGDIEEDADRQAALDSARGEMELIVAKQRQGGVGVVPLWCRMETNSVRDRSEHWE